MSDDKPVHVEGYAHTHEVVLEGVVPRAELERAVAEHPTVPLTVGGKVIGHAQLSVDDIGLHVTADIEPQDLQLVCVDEGFPVYDRVHGPLPDLIRADLCEFSIASDIGEVSITAREAHPRGKVT